VGDLLHIVKEAMHKKVIFKLLVDTKYKSGKEDEEDSSLEKQCNIGQSHELLNYHSVTVRYPGCKEQ